MAPRSRVLVLMFLLLPLVSGCIPKQVIVEEGPLLSASLEELVDLQKERTRKIQTVRALLSIHPEGERSFPASLKFIRDAGSGSPGIQVQGFDPLGRTVFELNSVNGDFRVRVSRNGRVAELGPDDPEIKRLPVSPAALLRMFSALVGPVIDPGETPILEPRGRFYIIHLIRVSGEKGRLSKRLLIDRKDLALTQVEFFPAGKDQNNFTEPVPKVVIDLRGNQVREKGDKNRISWPRGVSVGYRVPEAQEIPGLKLEFKEVHFNEGNETRALSSHKSKEGVK